MARRRIDTPAFLSLAALIVPGILLAGAGDPKPAITSAELMAHVKYLADDDLEGRAAGSAGEIVAAEYVAAEFERLGLKPMGDSGTYFQHFSVPRKSKKDPESTLSARVGSSRLRFKLERDIQPLPASATGIVEGTAVFAGYGVSTPDKEYDDYAGLEVKDRIVIVLGGAPGEEGDEHPDALRAKQDLAASHGAAALIVVNAMGEKLAKVKSRDEGKIPGLNMTYSAGKRLLSKAGLSIREVRRRIDSSLTPDSRTLDKLRLDLKVELPGMMLKARNVIGLLEATSQQTNDELVVIGAHFDHVGMGEFSSMGGSKASGEVHNGADDNASGTAAMMEIAGYLTPMASELRRDVLFIAFSGEEMGLLGSKQYVNSPKIPMHQTAAMINLDMVGYLKSAGKVDVYGAGNSPAFQKLLAAASRRARVKVREIRGPGGGYSDHYPFYQKQVPALFFFTGLHKNYHRPSDDWKAIDARGMERVARLAGHVASELARAEKRPVFTPTPEGGLEAGPYLGVTLEDRDQGVYVAGIAKGSPAAKSGIRKDDQILQVEESQITSTSVFYGIWANITAGTRVKFVIDRAGRRRSLRIPLKK